jgi:hypothetical protein
LILDSEGGIDAPLKKDRKYAHTDFKLIRHGEDEYVKTYLCNLSLGVPEDESLWISIEAEEMVECFVNGEFSGVSLWNRHEFNISPYLRPGENEIILKVTGNAANKFTDNKIPYGLKQ